MYAYNVFAIQEISHNKIQYFPNKLNELYIMRVKYVQMDTTSRRVTFGSDGQRTLLW